MPLTAEAREERAAWLRLVLTPGIGPRIAFQLFHAFGLPEQILAAGRAKIAAVLGDSLAGALLDRDDERDAAVAASLRWAEHDTHHLLVLTDFYYPKRLLDIGDPPPLLFVHGQPVMLSLPTLAIVGSRHPTPTGTTTAQGFAKAIADHGVQICSGLARGIDAAAHRGGLTGKGGTLAILGTGIDVVYPPEHAAMATTIAQRSALVSELPPGTGVRRENFPRRNRLIAGLSLGVLVVEAARDSGSLITARMATEFGREVMAIPGSIHSPVSKGCHQLIRDGAKLVESVEDAMVELRPQIERLAIPGVSPGFSRHRTVDPARRAQVEPVRPRRAARAAEAPPPPSLSPDASALLEALDWDPADPDTLADRTGQTVGAVTATMLELELAGLAERWIDGRYVRAARM